MVRSHRWLGPMAGLCLFGLAVGIGIADLARASEAARTGVGIAARPYQQGPLGTRQSDTALELPDGAEELFGLSVLAAILVGLRASGLGRDSKRS